MPKHFNSTAEFYGERGHGDAHNPEGINQYSGAGAGKDPAVYHKDGSLKSKETLAADKKVAAYEKKKAAKDEEAKLYHPDGSLKVNEFGQESSYRPKFASKTLGGGGSAFKAK